MVLPAVLLVAGCDRVLGAPGYRLAREEADPVEQLVSMFSPPNELCTECLTSACQQDYEACAASQSCTQLVTCLLDEPSPASEAWCVLQLQPNEPALLTSRALADCWRGCAVPCDGGQDFSCAGKYAWPVPQQDTVKLTQTLGDLFDANAPFSEATVTVCSPDPQCKAPATGKDGEPLVATTDATGTYTIEVPISKAPISVAGFRGFRRVASKGNLTHRLQVSTPLMTDRVEGTKLMRKAATDALLAVAEVTNELDIMVVQVFDCRGVGAQGVTVDFMPHARRLHYTDGNWLQEGGEFTLASQEGTLVAQLGARAFSNVQATDQTGAVVASGSVYLPGDDFVIYGLYPRSGAE